MVKQAKVRSSVGYEQALKRARKQPSQIADIEEIVSSVAGESNTQDFEVRAELYNLLAKAATLKEQGVILENYLKGLAVVKEEGRIDLQNLWQYFFDGERVRTVLVDKNTMQLIISTSPTEDVKHAAIYAVGLQSDTRNWSFPMKKSQAAFSMRLGESAVYFTLESHSENEESIATMKRPAQALDIGSGKLLWKWLPENENDGGVQRIKISVGNLLLMNGEFGDNLFVLDAKTQEEKWRTTGNFLCAFDGGFIVCKKSELTWLNRNGETKKIVKLPVPKPKKDKGRVGAFLETEDIIYISVRSSWSEWDKNEELQSHNVDVFYAVRKRDGKVQWSFAPTAKDVRYDEIISSEDWLYFCGRNSTVVLAKSSGKLVRDLPYMVLRVSDELLFHTDSKRPSTRDEFTFFARDTKTGGVKWQRKNFRLMAAKNSLLFGRVGNWLVVLDEETGKERASAVFDSEPWEIGFIDDVAFWVIDFQAKYVTVVQMAPRNS